MYSYFLSYCYINSVTLKLLSSSSHKRFIVANILFLTSNIQGRLLLLLAFRPIFFTLLYTCWHLLAVTPCDNHWRCVVCKQTHSFSSVWNSYLSVHNVMLNNYNWSVTISRENVPSIRVNSKRFGGEFRDSFPTCYCRYYLQLHVIDNIYLLLQSEPLPLHILSI